MAKSMRRVRDLSASSAVRTSAALGGSIPQPPVCTTAPTITGTATVGQTLTAVAGVYSGSPTVTRQWLRNGSAIPGETGTTYVLVSADSKCDVSVREKCANAVGTIFSRSAPKSIA